jgi:hypothetical protein
MISILLLSAFVDRATAVADEQVNCHQWTRTQWVQFRLDYATAVKNNSSNVPSSTDEQASQTLEECELEIQLLGLGSCFDRTQRFAKARRNMALNGYGFAISDEQYLAQQPVFMSNLPPELSNPDPALWKQDALKRGATYLGFTSASMQQPRLVFHDTIDGNDRFILTFVEKNNTIYAPYVDVIGVDRHKDPPQIYYREYSSLLNHQPVLNTRATGLANCYQCHLEGTRQIFPATGTAYTDALKGVDPAGLLGSTLINHRIENFNHLLASFPTPEAPGLLNFEDFGPAFGDGFRAGCQSCHDGEKQGFLPG